MSSSNKVGRPITLPGIYGDLARAVGGVNVLAANLRVSPRTIYDWAKGKAPGGPAQVLIEAECLKIGLTPPTWKAA